MSTDTLRVLGASKGVRAVRFVLEWALTVGIAFALLGTVGLMAGPRLLGWEGVIVLSGSMEPDLDVGGLAFVDPSVAANEISAGDVISFRSPSGQRVTHRVVEVIGSGATVSFRTKGDANDDPDPQLVSSRDLMGQVRFDFPYAGYVAERLRERVWFYLVLGVPAALLISNELVSIARELRRRKVVVT